ncbi:MAG: AraC family transcriptional regulator, partial [Psychroflexus sp.]|nr:AraC family transcriptional regulator [Psychroflexus sp.]
NEIELGRVEITVENEKDIRNTVAKVAKANGFQLLESPDDYLVERTKIEMINMLNHLPLDPNRKLSELLSEKLQVNYSKISRTFSSQEKVTLEKYFIKLKIERVKELIQNNQHNFTEIGYLLDYSNVNHLSRQFKNRTGMSLSKYKTEKGDDRKPLDQIV